MAWRRPQVKRDYRTPEGMSASEVDADSDGDVLVVLDLRVDSSMVSAGVAREIVNRCAWQARRQVPRGASLQSTGQCGR